MQLWKYVRYQIELEFFCALTASSWIETWFLFEQGWTDEMWIWHAGSWINGVKGYFVRWDPCSLKSSVSTATEQGVLQAEDTWRSKGGKITDSSSNGALPSVKKSGQSTCLRCMWSIKTWTFYLCCSLLCCFVFGFLKVVQLW